MVMRPPKMKYILKILTNLILILAGVVAAMVIDVQVRFIDKLYANTTDIRPAPVAMVLGASVKTNGEPSDALRDRLLVGQALYERKLVKKILITGDDGKYHIDEIRTMRNFLVKRGVPEEDILEDGRGYRTYESCKRAVKEFGVKKAIVITQRFHLGRALYLCNRLGMDAHGAASDLTFYRRILFFALRDIAASIEAWWDINIRPPRPPVGG